MKACGEDDDTEISPAPLRRLSALQYRNTLRDLFVPIGLDPEVEASSELARIPADDAGSSFRILDARVSEQHVSAYYRIADRLASAVVAVPAYLTALAGDCALEEAVSTSCVDGLLDGFGKRVHRRSMTDEERASYHALADESPDSTEAFRGIVFKLLLSPQLLYHVEVNGEGDDDEFSLGGYELASRVAYHFWHTLPDDELFAAAEDGSILDEDGFEAQLDRVFDDARVRQTSDRFYDEWLQLSWLTQFPQSQVFDAFAQGTSIGEAEADHLAAARDEIHALTQYFTFETDGSLADIYLTDLSLTQSPHLAALYGVEPWDGVNEPPLMPDGERAGLLTRVALLLTGTHETHPIHRGAVVRRRVLCDDLPTPDPAALPPGSLDSPPVTEDQTTRQRYEAKTADATCAGCHNLVNPVGFVLERYDALGRYRSEERIFDEATGEVLATLPVDSDVTLQLGSDARDLSSGLELSEEVVASGRAEACFARQYFRMTFGREEVDADTCTIDAVTSALTDESSLREALRAIAYTRAFRSRRVR
jgi:hypothetical protein